jgi:hypothetical protein
VNKSDDSSFAHANGDVKLFQADMNQGNDNREYEAYRKEIEA